MIEAILAAKISLYTNAPLLGYFSAFSKNLPLRALNLAPYLVAVWLLLGLLLLAVLWFTNREQVLRFGRILGE